MTNFSPEEWAGLIQGRALPGDLNCGERMPNYIHRKVQGLVDQRDELLAALENLAREVAEYFGEEDFTLPEARAAIAKAKGETPND